MRAAVGDGCYEVCCLPSDSPLIYGKRWNGLGITVPRGPNRSLAEAEPALRARQIKERQLDEPRYGGVW